MRITIPQGGTGATTAAAARAELAAAASGANTDITALGGLTGRVQLAKGVSVASANNLTLGSDGNVFHITGTTQINLLTSTGWQAGSVVVLIFDGILTVKNNQTVSGANKPILLYGAADFVTAANSALTLVYDGTSWFDTRLGQSVGSGNATTTTAAASEGGSPASGDVDFYSDGTSIARYSGSVWNQWGPIYAFTDPTLQSWAWINQVSATITETRGKGISLYVPGNALTSGISIRKKAAPSTPYTVTAYLLPNMLQKDSIRGGLCWRESSSGKLVQAVIGQGALNIFKFTNPTTFSASYTGFTFPTAVGIWLQISDDGSNRIIRFSLDGLKFIQLHTVGRTDFLTANEVGFCLDAGNNATPNIDAAITLLSWKET